MSVFKCKFTYKKNVKNSKKSTKNLLVEHKFIDQYFNILDLNKFRQANTELSNEASEILNEKVRLFAEENGGKKALPYEDAFKKIDIVNSKKVELPGKDFDETLAARMQAKLQELYPEIKLNITNNPIWEKGNNIFNQEEFNNQVNFRLKSIDILSSDKAKQVFEKGVKNKWSLDKILSELQVPKEQKQLIEGVLQTMSYYEEIPFNEQIALALAETFGYTIEINTAKEKNAPEDYVKDQSEYYENQIKYADKFYVTYEREGKFIVFSNNFDVLRQSSWGSRDINSPKFNTKEEAEIYRKELVNSKIESDKIELQKIKDFKPTLKNTKYYSNLTVPGGTNYTEKAIKLKGVKLRQGSEGVYHENEFNNSEGDMLAWSRQDELSTDTSIVRIQEIQSRLQKHRGETKLTEGSEADNTMLQLFAKDDNWVTFVIKSLVQQAAKDGKSKIWFPKGETAAKIEGHQTLAEKIVTVDNRIKEFEIAIKYGGDTQVGVDFVGQEAGEDLQGYRYYLNTDKDTDTQIKISEAIINLKKYKEALKSQGIEKLKPIEAFYEIKVGNILEKQFGKENVKTITDEYGNTWNELTINQARDLANVMLQRNEANQIIGQANIKAMTVLIDAINQKQDTLPHEYAHHYIAWNRNTLIVQEAIKKWGGEEALVQSIGEQSVKQKGEAWSWWQKFVKWLLGDLSKLSKLDKERLTKILTDAFLTRQDLSTLGKPAEVKRIDSNVLQVNINSQEQFLEYLNNNKDKIIILESNSELSTINAPGIGELSNIPMDNVMTINTINSSKEELVESFENIDIELRADGTFDVVFINDNYGSQLKNSNPVLYTTLNTLLKNNFNFNNTNTDLIEAAENNDAQFEYQLTIDFSETADVLNNLTCK
jgi:hypothetical protein